jgi:hypothetical protein
VKLLSKGTYDSSGSIKSKNIGKEVRELEIEREKKYVCIGILQIVYCILMWLTRGSYENTLYHLSCTYISLFL